MYGDKSKQNFRQKLPQTTVASEASKHRQKIAHLRSNFLAAFAGSSASSSSNNQSFPSEEFPSRPLPPRIRESVVNNNNNNGFPAFPYRLPSSSIQPSFYSPSLPAPTPPVGNLPAVPRRIARRSTRVTPNPLNNSNSALTQIADPINSLPPQSRISEPQMPSWGFPSPSSNDPNCPTIVYEALTSLRGPDANVLNNYSQSSVHNSAMFYHRSVVEPPSVITLSPSEPLCLYAARQSGLCRSCQKLAHSGASSFHRSSSRHSVSHHFAASVHECQP